MNRFSILLATLFLIWLGTYARELPLPTVPDNLRTPKERAEYIALHFWDEMDWRDTTLTSDDRFMEQTAVNYYSVFHLLDSVSASKALTTMLDAASVSQEAYKRIAHISRNYLYDPESPVADDESFLVLADCLLVDKKLSDSDQLRIADAKRTAMLNRVGSMATDFEFIDRDGRTSTLREALRLHPRSYLIFYDPDCHVCQELEESLMAVDLGDTGVVMISPYGEQDGLWLQHAATLPPDWIVGRPLDDNFEDLELYDLRSTPTVLILDSTSTVLSKGMAH